MILSYPSIASLTMALNTPAAIHSSRRSRTVVSDTLFPTEPLGILPGAPRHQADEHHLEAVPIIGAGSMTTERMVIHRLGNERFDSSPDDINHFGIEGAHDIRGPPLGRLVFWVAPRLSRGHTNDRWMVTTLSG